MESMIVTQGRDTAVNIRNIYCIDITSARTLAGKYALTAWADPQVSISLGYFTKKAMAEDVRDDILKWNYTSSSRKSEYRIPDDNPDWDSQKDAIELYGAKMRIDKV